jgi:(1->4)-alpha-D-glucan 1-alpha-D-glucosylmutase
MDVPTATYRIQFNPDFGFAEARRILDYLEAIGISHIYASPIFQACAGSTHGYDVTDPNRLNPELGGMDDFTALRQVMERCGMGWIQDVVPNHMAYSHENPMVADVWENGKRSSFFDFFDIQWDYPYEGIRGRVLAPFLGKPYGETLEDGDLVLEYTRQGFQVRYYDLVFPLRIESYGIILTHQLSELEKELGRDHPDYINLLGLLYVLQTLSAGKDIQEHYDQTHFVKGILWDLYTRNPVVASFLDRNTHIFNGSRGDPDSFGNMDRLLLEQYFRLSFWKVATEEINYRRFFSINDLICLKTQDPHVFEHTHSLVFDLIQNGRFTGLRIDHVDGLYDPYQYMAALRSSSPDAWIVVEKILGIEEPLPSSWPIQGTTGYDFLNYANGLFCMNKHEKEMTRHYETFTGHKVPYATLVSEKKRLIIEKHMGGDVDNLALLLQAVSSRDRYGRDITLYGLKRALVELLAQFPVYRTYQSQTGLSDTDGAYIRTAVDRALQHTPALMEELRFIERFLLAAFPDYLTGEEKEQWMHFIMKFQQLTGPLMAKGFEDTTLYIYNRLLSLNEVGGDPGRFGISKEAFHRFNQERRHHWPHTLNATATHDTKRGEDARARIQVLSEIPKEWRMQVQSWAKLNRKKRVRLGNRWVPDRNDEYFLYQTLIGSFPHHGTVDEQYVQRMKDYMIKAVREAKVHTAWLKPDTDYEEGYLSFIDRVLMTHGDNPFLREFIPFQRKIAHFGMFNSLSQTLLKVTSPGLPDFYQGTELWDLSLVDPDNRRPVDFLSRRGYLNEVRQEHQRDAAGLIRRLSESWTDGRIKLFLIYRALQTRKTHDTLFQKGDYQPLQVEGPFNDHVIAYARMHRGQWAVAVAPRFLTVLLNEGQFPLGTETWRDTCLVLPEDGPAVGRDAFTGEPVEMKNKLQVGDALRHFPVSLLLGEKEI